MCDGGGRSRPFMLSGKACETQAGARVREGVASFIAPRGAQGHPRSTQEHPELPGVGWLPHQTVCKWQSRDAPGVSGFILRGGSWHAACHWLWALRLPRSTQKAGRRVYGGYDRFCVSRLGILTLLQRHPPTESQFLAPARPFCAGCGGCLGGRGSCVAQPACGWSLGTRCPGPSPSPKLWASGTDDELPVLAINTVP